MGFIAGLALAIILNLVPYMRTRGAYQTDGLEVIGFPMVFRSLGGFTYALDFFWPALAVDILFATALAFTGGLVFCKLQMTK